MAWYWIVLIVVGYLIMWVSTAVVLYQRDDSDFEVDLVLAVTFGMLWPILFIPAIIAGIVKFLTKD